jgi:hypothetical protein
MKKQNNLLDILILIGLLLVIIWKVLDSAGFTSSEIKLISYLGLGIAGIGTSYKISKIMKDVNNISRNVHKLSVSFENLEKHFKKN